MRDSSDGPALSLPDGCDAAVSLTFDVDAEAGVLGRNARFRELTSLSAGRYGVVRGLPRVRSILERRGIRGTFYAPGMTAELHPDAIRELVDDGHELGHHGHRHLSSDRATADEQRWRLNAGLKRSSG